MRPRLFESSRQVELPNVHYFPGLVWVRRCSACGATDKRAWYANIDAARQASERGSWECSDCAGPESMVGRGWFDAIFG
jgi:hypothetical protein